MQAAKKTTRYLRYTFSEEELTGKAKQLALSVQRKTQAEEEKAAVVSKFTERIKAETATSSQLARDLNSGWEMRDISCVVLLNDPSVGRKTIARADTGEIVEVENMSGAEMQQALPLDQKPEAEPSYNVVLVHEFVDGTQGNEAACDTCGLDVLHEVHNTVKNKIGEPVPEQDEAVGDDAESSEP